MSSRVHDQSLALAGVEGKLEAMTLSQQPGHSHHTKAKGSLFVTSFPLILTLMLGMTQAGPMPDPSLPRLLRHHSLQSHQISLDQPTLRIPARGFVLQGRGREGVYTFPTSAFQILNLIPP